MYRYVPYGNIERVSSGPCRSSFWAAVLEHSVDQLLKPYDMIDPEEWLAIHFIFIRRIGSQMIDWP